MEGGGRTSLIKFRLAVERRNDSFGQSVLSFDPKYIVFTVGFLTHRTQTLNFLRNKTFRRSQKNSSSVLILTVLIQNCSNLFWSIKKKNQS